MTERIWVDLSLFGNSWHYGSNFQLSIILNLSINILNSPKEAFSCSLVITHPSYPPFPGCGCADSPNWNAHHHFLCLSNDSSQTPSPTMASEHHYYKASLLQYFIGTLITLLYAIHLLLHIF